MNKVVLSFLLCSFLCSCTENIEQDRIALGETNKSITFYKDIAPILFTNCLPCHLPEGGAPFSIINYKEARRKAKTIAEVTRLKLMPPWPADKNYSSFINEKGLTDKEIELIQLWVNQGAKEGDSKSFSNMNVGYSLPEFGKADLVLRMPKSFLIKGDNKDKFVVMKLPFELPHDTFIKAIEFVPGNIDIVHHMNGHLINYSPRAKQNIYDGLSVLMDEDISNIATIDQMSLKNDDGSYPAFTASAVNYLPGVSPVLYPEGIGGFYMSKKGLILMKNIHYGPSPIDQTDSSHFNIYYAKQAPNRPLREMILGTSGISEVIPNLIIEANEIKKCSTVFRLPIDISLLTINPHMHLLGKDFLAYAIKPSGDTIPLIKINKWNFHWQYYYTFKKILKLPQGTMIYVYGTFDNTVTNSANPFNPPRKIIEPKGYMKTTDEMFQFIMTYLPYKKGDEEISLE